MISLCSSISNLPTSCFPVTIRTAQENDIHQLTDIVTKSFYPPEKSWRWLYNLWKFSIHEDLRHRLHLNSPEYECFVATIKIFDGDDEQELLVGTVEIAIRSQLYFAKKNNKSYPYISNLAIHSEYRRQGIANKLLKQCEQTALEWGLSDICLHVLENNYPAQQLYQKNGYQLAQIDSTMISWLFNRPKRCFLIKSL